jgi:hypothetical protein
VALGLRFNPMKMLPTGSRLLSMLSFKRTGRYLQAIDQLGLRANDVQLTFVGLGRETGCAKALVLKIPFTSRHQKEIRLHLWKSATIQ